MSPPTNHSGLTILLPLKGRHLYTIRFLWHANRQRATYRFLIADADPHPALQEAMERGFFSNLDIDYRRYPPDRDLACYYRKMASAAREVSTPFVMLADNDDFLIPSGIDRCVSWLEAHPEYASCGGAVMGLELEPRGDGLEGVVGDVRRYAGLFHGRYRDVDHAAEDTYSRVLDGFYRSIIYYNVMRAEVMRRAHDAIERISPSHLIFHESLFELAVTSAGRVRVDHDYATYIRQRGTSMHAHVPSLDYLLETDIGSDVRAIAQYLVEACGVGADAGKAEGIRKLLQAHAVRVLQQALEGNGLAVTRPPVSAATAMKALVQHVPVLGTLAKNAWTRVRASHAARKEQAQLRRWAQRHDIGIDFRLIDDTLHDRDLEAFLSRYGRRAGSS